MNAKPKSYLDHPTDATVARTLVTVNQASETYKCSPDTLRNNARSGSLPAYQQRQGAPVYLRPSEVEAFLLSRPDISSTYQEAATAQELELPAPWQVNERTETSARSAVGGSDEALLPLLKPLRALKLNSLKNATEEQIDLVARCLREIANSLSPEHLRR